MAEIPLAPLERVLRKGGAERVSGEAIEVLRDTLEDYTILIGKRATALANHAGRKTIKASDVKLAIKDTQKTA